MESTKGVFQRSVNCPEDVWHIMLQNARRQIYLTQQT